MKFTYWYDKRLTVSHFPESNELLTFDVIINVSDEDYTDKMHDILHQHKIRYYWFPMNEAFKDIGLNAILGACTVLYKAFKHQKSVLLHCHAGKNRSVSVQEAFHLMMTGKLPDKEHSNYRLLDNCERNLLPSFIYMKLCLLELKDMYDKGLANICCAFDLCKKHIKNF